MSGLRSAFRLTNRLAMPRPGAVRTTVPSGTRAFSSTVPGRKKSAVIKETEVPVSVYAPDSKGVAGGNQGDRFSIPVRPNGVAIHPSPLEENDPVVPLEPEIFNKMPRTMQKMSVMDKVIIITG